MRSILLITGIVIIAVLVAGCTQSVPPPAPAPVATSIPTAVPTTTPSSQVSVTPGSVQVPAVTPLSIPAAGVYVYVNYLGSFSGSYGPPVNLQAVQDSGERLYPVTGLNGTVSAGFAKLDRSTHPLTVTIYKDATLVKTATSSDPWGMVNITANV